MTEQQPVLPHDHSKLHRVVMASAASLAVVAAISVAGCAVSHQKQQRHETSHEQNVLTGTWGYMPGTTVNSDKSLTVTHSGESVLTFKDDTQPGEAATGREANPPINTYGTHLALAQAGGFAVKAHLTEIKGTPTLSLYSGPSIRYDEHIVRLPSLDVTLDGAQATLDTYGSPGAKPQTHHFPFRRDSAAADITVSQDKGQLTVTVNGARENFSVHDSGVSFPSAVWFGFDTDQSFKVSRLTAAPLKGDKLTLDDTSRENYGGATQKYDYGNRLVGTAVDLPVLMADPNYAKFIIENFNEIETESLAKFQALQPEEGKYQFAELDALVDFAHKHHLTVYGHALIFGEAYPDWLQQKLASSNHDQAAKLLTDYITTVVSRYDGKHGHGEIKYWDVVNEPFDADNYGQLAPYNLWYKALGSDYIKLAFQAAHKADPDGVYAINEYAVETDSDQAGGMRNLVANVNADGKLIDAVGFQAHFDEDTLNDDQAMDDLYGGSMRKEFAYYASQGLKVRVSEASVAQNGDDNAKTRAYGALASDCAQASNCIGYNLWGAVNNTGLYFYMTGDITTKDPGDDAPATQTDTGPVVKEASFYTIQKALAKSK